jgi:hypothetical protein
MGAIMTSTGLIGKGLTRIATSLRVASRAVHLLGAWLLVVSLLIAGKTSSAHAQTRSASRTIDGAVTDTGLAPLALGYASASTVAHLTAHDTLRASFALERAPTELDPVVVAASHAPTRMAEFEHRRKVGEGQFMTQAEIEKRNEPITSDLLRTFMSVAVGVTAVNRRMLPTRGCPFQFFLDDIAIPTPRIDAELPSPKELAGIEVYANSATVPLQYKTISGGGFCGVILLWTRS